MIAAAATGEMVGFRVLYWGGGAPTDQWYVIAALVAAGFAVVIPALWSPTRQRQSNECRRPPHASSPLGFAYLAAPVQAVAGAT